MGSERIKKSCEECTWRESGLTSFGRTIVQQNCSLPALKISVILNGTLTNLQGARKKESVEDDDDDGGGGGGGGGDDDDDDDHGGQ